MRKLIFLFTLLITGLNVYADEVSFTASAPDAVVSGEQFKESKPNPEIYLYTIKELNVNKDEAIIIEDSSKGILAANRAGIKVLALKDDKFGLDQSQADIIIDELNDIIKLIEKGA